MSPPSSKIEKKGFIDTEYSAGDCNKMKRGKKYQEENNNEVDVLSADLEMGCIVDAVKRPPNICVETCVYEDSETEVNEDPEADYDDDFEEEHSDGNDSIKMEPKLAVSDPSTLGNEQPESSVKLSKSHSFMSSKQNVSVSGKSAKTLHFGNPPSIPKTRRVNMSFTNDRLREIERHNHILLKKILTARNGPKSSIPVQPKEEIKRVTPSAAVHRKKQQRQIDYENMILLKRIQRAKSSAYSIRR